MEDSVLKVACQTLLTLKVRQGIESIQEYMRSLPQTPIRTRHFFPEGQYIREITIPKGTALIGEIHRREYADFVLQGEVDVLTEDGIRNVKAPAIFITQPGKKRIGVAIEETVWATVHPNPENETDLDALEKELLAETYDEVEPLAGCDIPRITRITYQCADPEERETCLL